MNKILVSRNYVNLRSPLILSQGISVAKENTREYLWLLFYCLNFSKVVFECTEMWKCMYINIKHLKCIVLETSKTNFHYCKLKVEK